MTTMSTVAAVFLLSFGALGIAVSWNAAKPVINPTRRYSPLWLPAMVVTSLAPVWLLIQLGVLGVAAALGGFRLSVGAVGGVMLLVSAALTVWLLIRSAIGIRRLRTHVEGVVHPARGAARWRGRPIPTPPGVVEEDHVVWRDDLTLDLIKPSRAIAGAPVVIYAHGGGWTGGDPQHQARDLYHALALDGWLVAAVRYPLTPFVTVEHQIARIKNAVEWASSTWSPSRIVLAGGSAGGHLATIAAMTPTNPGQQVDACVGMYAVYDMANRNRTRAPWTKIRREVMQASVEHAPDRYRAVSPLDQIDQRTPPMLVVHGTHDTLVPIGEAKQFVEALRSGRRPVTFLPVYGAQHAFDAFSSRSSRATAAAIRTWLRRNVLEDHAPMA